MNWNSFLPLCLALFLLRRILFLPVFMKWSWNLNDSISVFFFFKAFNESNSSSSESQDIEINACFEHIIDHIGHKTQFPRKRSFVIVKNYHRTISTKNPHTSRITINKPFAVNPRLTKKKTHAHRLKQPPFSSKLDHHFQRFTIRLSRTLSPIEKTLSLSLLLAEKKIAKKSREI